MQNHRHRHHDHHQQQHQAPANPTGPRHRSVSVCAAEDSVHRQAPSLIVQPAVSKKPRMVTPRTHHKGCTVVDIDVDIDSKTPEIRIPSSPDNNRSVRFKTTATEEPDTAMAVVVPTTIAHPSGGGGGCASRIENEVDPESLWYDRSDLIRFRHGAMKELEEPINRQNLSNRQQQEELQRADSSIPLSPRDHQMQQRTDVEAMSFARRKHKAAILRCVVLFYKRGNPRECVAALYRKLNKWNKDIALRDASLRYEEVYGPNNNTIGGGGNSRSSSNGDHDSLPPRRWVSSTPPRLSLVKRRSCPTTEVCTPSLSSSSPPETIMPN